MPVAVIAAELGRHRSTIHREIRRNFYHDPFRDRWGQEYRCYYCTTADAYAHRLRARRARPLTVASHARTSRGPVHLVGRQHWRETERAERMAG
uniref:Integrase catalytic region n=1 Tax=Azospirillum baldaniorum TaxID=1064539 RepID=E5DGB1_9PROT|nr:integrase catalytic region [Azospirillum baldaniorum]